MSDKLYDSHEIMHVQTISPNTLYRISHYWRWYMIFILWVMCFLPSLGDPRGDRKHTTSRIKIVNYCESWEILLTHVLQQKFTTRVIPNAYRYVIKKYEISESKSFNPWPPTPSPPQPDILCHSKYNINYNVFHL